MISGDDDDYLPVGGGCIEEIDSSALNPGLWKHLVSGQRTKGGDLQIELRKGLTGF